MNAPPVLTQNKSTTKQTACLENRQINDLEYYDEQRIKDEKYVQGNEFLTITETLNALNARIISLLNSGVKCLKIGCGQQGNN